MQLQALGPSKRWSRFDASRGGKQLQDPPGLGSATQDANSVAITGGSIDMSVTNSSKRTIGDVFQVQSTLLHYR